MDTTGWPGGHIGGSVLPAGSSPSSPQLPSLWLGGICSEMRQSAPAQGGEQ